MHIISNPSPNVSERKKGVEPDMIVLHYTDMLTAEDAVKRLTDPRYEVSAHYLIDQDGLIYRLVDDTKKAWHAGISCWRGRAALNDYSIGIELANPGHTNGYTRFPVKQINSCIALCTDITRRYVIPPEHIVAHSDIAPLRKKDPGELFPWHKLAESGIGIWPTELKQFAATNNILLFPHTKETELVKHVQLDLTALGYYLRVDGEYGIKTEKTIEAFKRRYVQHNVSVTWDEHSAYAVDILKRNYTEYKG